MIRIPKFGDPADAMARMSLYRGNPVAQRSITCPSSQLMRPQLNPAIEQVDTLMTFSRSEMADLISRQRNVAEEQIQEIRETQQEQLSTPASTMELYYMDILKTIRAKEQAEVDNAYLTQQQKNDLNAEALRTKAGIDGNLVRRADELVKQEKEVDDILAKASEDFVATEASVAQSGTADPESAASAAASGASAAGDTRRQAGRRQADVDTLQGISEDLRTFRKTLNASAVAETGKKNTRSLAVKSWVINNQVRLVRDIGIRMQELVRIGAYASTTAEARMRDAKEATRDGNLDALDRILEFAEKAVLRRA